jgi:hypothetical protein
MHSVAAGAQRRRDQRADVQVAVGGSAGADAHHAVCEAGRQAVAIGLGDGGHRLDTQRLARADDPQRNLAAVGDQHAPEAHADR